MNSLKKIEHSMGDIKSCLNKEFHDDLDVFDQSHTY